MRIFVFLIVGFIAIGAGMALLIERGENPFEVWKEKTK
jgi:hypothetical protein